MLEQVAHKNCGCPIIQGWVGWGPEQPDLVNAPGLDDLQRSIPTQTILYFHDSAYALKESTWSVSTIPLRCIVHAQGCTTVSFTLLFCPQSGLRRENRYMIRPLI